MKNLLLASIGIGVVTLAACHSGGSSNTPSSLTPYNLQGYNLQQNISTQNCTLADSSHINCSGNQVAGVYTVSFTTPEGSPGAYVQLPESSLYGVTVAQSNGGSCPQSASAPGETYTCNFSITSNGTAQAGNSILLPVNGSLGAYTLISIQLQ